MSASLPYVDILKSAKRILVLGPCGAGKSVFTRQLSKTLGLPAVHLDAIFWRPGYQSTPQAEWRAMVKSLIRKDRWLMDGTYEATLDLRIPAAEAIIMLRHPRLSCLWGVAKRGFMCRNKMRPDAPAGYPVNLAYLRYLWNYSNRTETLINALIEEHGPNIPVITLDNRKSVESLILALRAGFNATQAGHE